MAYTRKRTAKRTRPKDRTCYETAVYLLQFRDQSEKDLTRKLKEREYTEKEIEEAMERIKGYAQRGDIVMCSQTLTTFDIPWIQAAGGPWLNMVRHIFDTGMLLKSAAIPTLVLPGEIDVQFYERIDNRAMSMRYGVDGFVLPKLSSVGLLQVPHGPPGTPGWRNAGYDSYASLRMMQELRQMCYQFVAEVTR